MVIEFIIVCSFLIVPWLAVVAVQEAAKVPPKDRPPVEASVFQDFP